jgi:uncharacterized protein with HEPN domain
LSKGDDVFVDEMVEAAEKIAGYVAGLDEAAFLGSPVITDAVALNLLVIGEAANRVSAGLKLKEASIPWAELVGLRNRIAHGYSHIDRQTVWDIMTEDLPGLRAELNQLKALLERD